MPLSQPAVYGLGACIVATIIGMALSSAPMSHLGYWATNSVFVLSAALGGAFGGWLCWWLIAKSSPLSLSKAVGMAAGTVLSSLMCGSILGSLAFAAVGFVMSLEIGWGDAFMEFLNTMAFGLVVAPIYTTIMYGLQFSIFVLVWTLWRRRVANRLVAA